MKERFKEILKAYEKQILYANACNECFFKMKYGKKEWEEAYKIAPAFFQLTMKGMQSEAFLEISKMFERENRSDHNFHKLLNYVQSNSQRISIEKYDELNQIVEIYRDKILIASDVAAKILIIRDKIIAHNDKSYFANIDKNNLSIDLSFEDVKGLLDLAGEIVNRFNRLLFDSYTHMHYSNADDFERLMEFCLRNIRKTK